MEIVRTNENYFIQLAYIDNENRVWQGYELIGNSYWRKLVFFSDSESYGLNYVLDCFHMSSRPSKAKK